MSTQETKQLVTVGQLAAMIHQPTNVVRDAIQAIGLAPAAECNAIELFDVESAEMLADFIADPGE